jgi:hypothetical protein
MRKPMLALALLFAAPLAAADDCPWLPDSRIDAAFPDRAPFAIFAGAAGQGRCKWIGESNSTISLVQMIKASPAEAEDYVKTVGGGMAKSYDVKPAQAIGSAGVAVRESGSPADGRMLTLIGHRGNEVIMTQMSFHEGVSAAQQAEAEKLTIEMFGKDTGGGLQMPSR